jgi:hypothetical protein
MRFFAIALGVVAAICLHVPGLVADIQPSNHPPTIMSEPPTSARVDQQYNYYALGTDPDGDQLSWSLVQGPVWMTLNPTSGLVSWTPNNAEVGFHTVKITVSDGNGGSATQTFTIQVMPP